MYRDTTLLGTFTNMVGTITTNERIVVGASVHAEASERMDGNIDDVRIVNGAALTPLSLPTATFPTQSATSTTYAAQNVFDTVNTGLVGTDAGNAWRSAPGCNTHQRLVCTTPGGATTVRKLRVVNYHDNAGNTGYGVRNASVYVFATHPGPGFGRPTGPPRPAVATPCTTRTSRPGR